VRDLLGLAIVLAIVGGIVWLPLRISGRARVSYGFAALVTATVFVFVWLPFMYIGVGLVAPTDFQTMAPGLLMYGAMFLGWYAVWCLVVVGKQLGHG
jgi:hypothetical protein